MAALQPETKYFIITAGATGSGKTGLIFETAETLGYLRATLLIKVNR
jgi:Ni2+-binding GTPase involved in maturation of urease and hydrogenase